MLPLLGCDAGSSGQIVSPATTAPDPGVAVVELFTSEGCSSCPPAEVVLGEIGDAADKGGRPVFALAFHVDYWNRLGWTDPFSSAAFSARQGHYSQLFGLDEVYTPQMIVNGRAQFNGSDRAAATAAIADALSKPAPAKIAVKVAPAEGGGYGIHYAVTGADKATTINVAVIERGLSSHVERGENAGRDLRDPDVVRWFASQDLKGDGTADVALPALAGVDMKRASVVVYAQRNADGGVIGAAASRFP